MRAAPAVLRAIAATEARASGRHEVSVCGDAAADPLVIPLLIGVGVTALSVAPAALDEVRAVVRSLDTRACRDVAASIIGAGAAI